MKKLVLGLAVALTLAGCQDAAKDDTNANAAESIPLETLDQKVSYIMGLDSGKRINQPGMTFDTEIVLQGMRDGLTDAEQRLSDEQIQQTITEFQEKMMAEQEALVKAEADKNQAEGEAFLAENATKEGVVVTDSGLQYRVIEAGTGAKPTAESKVEVNYEGKLIDGTVFDSSYSRGEPVQFGVTQVIAGWTEVLQLMSEGAKWEVYIPADLAYGPAGNPRIGPNSTLIFTIELLKANVSEE